MNLKVPIHQFLYSTVRIEADLPNGTSVGTGFIAEYKFENNYFLFLVTNKHVVDKAIKGRFFFTKADEKNEPKMGDRLDIEADFKKVWQFHPNGEDIAFTPFLPLLFQIERVMEERVYIKPIPLSLIPNKEQEEKLTALEEVIFIGYPSAIYDTKNLLPIIRKGTTATPIPIDYEGKPLFLIDASVFPGSSGSPVFIYNFGSYSDTDGGLVPDSRIYFVGVISQVLINEEYGKIEFKEIPSIKVPTYKTNQILNLGVVIKSRVIIETVEPFLQRIKPKLYINEKLGKFDRPQIDIAREKNVDKL